VSYPSGTYLVAALVEDRSQSVAIRILAAKACRTQQALLRLIKDPDTPKKLKAAAVLRYDELTQARHTIREVKRARRSIPRSTETMEAAD